MKNEIQIVIAGFLLGILFIALNIIRLSKVEKNGYRELNLWRVELDLFLFNSFLGTVGILFGVLSLVYALAALVQGFWEERGASAFSVVIGIAFIWGIYCLYLYFEHPSIIMGKYFDRKYLVKSIKEEGFRVLENNIMVSEHWLYIGGYFVPRTCIIGADTYHVRGYDIQGKHYHFIIYSVDGEATYCRTAIITSKQTDISTLIKIIAENTPVNNFLSRFTNPLCGLNSRNEELKDAFSEYLEQNEDADMFNDNQFANIIVGNWKKMTL